MENIQRLSALRNNNIVLTNMPMPPSENMSYPTGRNGRRFKSKDLTNFQKYFKLCFDAFGDDKKEIQRLVAYWMSEKYRLSVFIRLFFKEERILTKDKRSKRLDTTNRLKAACDSLAESIGIDDKEFWYIKASKEISQASFEYCDIRVVPLSTEPINDAEIHA